VTGWIPLGICSLAVVVLVGSVLPLLTRLSQLRDIQYKLHQQARQAQELAPAVAGMRQRAAEVEIALRGVRDRAEALNVKRRSA
jgi:heme exporter protein D